MMAPLRLVRRCWLGMVAVPVIGIIFLATNSPSPNSGPSTAPPDRTRSGPEAAIAADNKSVPPMSPEELATGLEIDSEVGLTLAPLRMSRAVSPDHWLGPPASKPVPDTLWGKHT